jgi:hypothetical protein
MCASSRSRRAMNLSSALTDLGTGERNG